MTTLSVSNNTIAIKPLVSNSTFLNEDRIRVEDAAIERLGKISKRLIDSGGVVRTTNGRHHAFDPTIITVSALAEFVEATDPYTLFGLVQIAQEQRQVLVADLEQDDPVRIRQERDMLANAIVELGIKTGLMSPNVLITGPHLLMICEDLSEAIQLTKSE